VTLFQDLEGLPDRQAAEAVRTRIDWKYALGLSLTDPGFDFSVLSEFRARLVEQSAAERLLDVLLEACQKNGWLAGGGRQRTDSPQVLARVRRLNRIDLVGETLRAALNALAEAAPDWLQEHRSPDWWERYALPFDVTGLAKSEAEREAMVLTGGQDGLTLLAALEAEPQVVWLREIPAMQTLQQVWKEHYQVREGTLLWRPRDDLPPARTLIASPSDLDARYALKRATEWVGYTVHLTETGDVDKPHLITQVMTTPAPSAESAVTTPIQQALERKGLLPGQQIVDTGYVDAGEGLRSQSRGVVLVGPVPPTTAATPAAFALEQVTLQGDKQQANLSSRESQRELAPS
jgi:transposase